MLWVWGGYDGRLWAKTKERLASNTALRSGKTFMGFTDSCSGGDKVYVLMIVLVLRSNFFLNICDILIITNKAAVCVEVFRGAWCLKAIVSCDSGFHLFSLPVYC